MKLLGRTIRPWTLLLGAAIVLYLASGVHTVARDEEGVALLFGAPWGERFGPGIHYVPPPPFGKWRTVRAESAYQMSVGFKIADRVRGKDATPEESEFLTGDTNILAVEMVLQYVIDDPLALLYAVEEPHFLVRRTAEATLSSFLARTHVDEALTSGRAALLESVRLGAQEKLREAGAGILLVSATLKRIEPPTEVVDAFQDVQNAKADRERTINESRGLRKRSAPPCPRGSGSGPLVCGGGEERARGNREWRRRSPGTSDRGIPARPRGRSKPALSGNRRAGARPRQSICRRRRERPKTDGTQADRLIKTMPTTLTVSIYLVLIAGISFAGGAAPLLRTWSRDRITLLVTAGAGVLLGAAFIHMIPHIAEHLGHRAGFPLLAGFLVIFILEKFFLIDPCEEVGCDIHKFGFAAFLGITFHSLIDGVAVGSSLVIPNLAPPVFFAIAVHKIPAAFCLCSILLLAGYSRGRTLLHILGFSVSTPIGAIISYYFLRDLDQSILAMAVGFSAGSFLAIATSDLLPQLHREGMNRALSLGMLLAGVTVMVISGVMVPH